MPLQPLPNGFQQRRLANTLIEGNQRQAFRPRGGGDEAAGGVVREVIGKLRSQSGNLRADRFDGDALKQPVHRTLDGSEASNTSSRH